MITLTGQTPSHKNSKQLFKAGGRTFIANNSKYLAWRKGAVLEAKCSQERYRGETVYIGVVFYLKDRRARDLDNMLASVLDVLVEAGVIDDDNINVVRQIGISYGGISRNNPRAEVRIILISELGK